VPVTSFEDEAQTPFQRFTGRMHRLSARISRLRLPARAGLVATLALFAATGAYGVALGGHGPALSATLRSVGDGAANAVGFGITEITLTGQMHVKEGEILAAAGVTPATSLLLLDAEDTRQRIAALPWIASVTVQKLYPGRLVVEVKERDAFALWQRHGRLQVIASDGTVIAPHTDPRFNNLPLVVGPGAETRAKAFFDLLDRYPVVRGEVRAAVLVAERRWNLRLKNGIDVRLPETGIEAALARLTELDRTRRLMSRDVVTIDMRMPDRVAVRLSEEAAQARTAALQARQRPQLRRRGTDT
jgi:cell division protein FtsQ